MDLLVGLYILFSAAVPEITLSSCMFARYVVSCVLCFVRAVFCYNVLVHDHAHHWATLP